MRKTGLLFFAALSLSSSVVFGFGEKHSKVETKANVVGQNLEIEVLVKPDADMQISKEGPWQVAFTQAPGLNLEMKDGKFVSKAFDESVPGFKVTAPIASDAKSGRIDYDVKAFVCSKDKTKCFPQQHKGTIDWKKS